MSGPTDSRVRASAHDPFWTLVPIRAKPSRHSEGIPGHAQSSKRSVMRRYDCGPVMAWEADIAIAILPPAMATPMMMRSALKVRPMTVRSRRGCLREWLQLEHALVMQHLSRPPSSASLKPLQRDSVDGDRGRASDYPTASPLSRPGARRGAVVMRGLLPMPTSLWARVRRPRSVLVESLMASARWSVGAWLRPLGEPAPARPHRWSKRP